MFKKPTLQITSKEWKFPGQTSGTFRPMEVIVIGCHKNLGARDT
jgi:hypothetical protein